MAAVTMRGITARYASDPTPRLVNVSLEVGKGRICALLGPNGAGKSSVIRVLSSQLSPDAGEVTLLGDALDRLTNDERARRVAVVPQRSEVAFGFTVREVVMMGRAPHQGALMRSTRADVEVVDQALATSGLTDLADRSVGALSGGEQKRVHIARALAQRASILLLDEAAAHLDVRHALELYDVVHREVQARDLTCLMTTHDLAAAAAHADEVVLLRGGEVVAHGAVDDVMTAEPLEATFEVPITIGQHGDGRRYFLPNSASI
jgi:ABC-type cobalamin/Fe3+-siderophores transport system ATPase subunit